MIVHNKKQSLAFFLLLSSIFFIPVTIAGEAQNLKRVPTFKIFNHLKISTPRSQERSAYFYAREEKTLMKILGILGGYIERA